MGHVHVFYYTILQYTIIFGGSTYCTSENLQMPETVCLDTLLGKYKNSRLGPSLCQPATNNTGRKIPKQPQRISDFLTTSSTPPAHPPTHT